MRSLALCILLSVVATSLGAQQEPVPDEPWVRILRDWSNLEGARLRLTDSRADGSTPVEGTLRDHRGDTLLLDVPGSASLVAVFASADVGVERWTRSDPRNEMTALGAVVGAVVGGFAGFKFAPPAEPRCRRQSSRGFFDYPRETDCASTTPVAIEDMLGGAIVGGAIGALGFRYLGRRLMSEGWEPVPGYRISVGPNRRGQVVVGLRTSR